MDGLKTIEVVGKTEGPHLLITAGVHGDEFEGIEALHRLKGFILPEKICGSVTIVPVVNESAFALRNRCGADGLDLARTCPGKHDGSVTQRAAAALVQLIVTADLYMDLHSGGVAMEVYPLAGYMLVESNSVIEKQRRMAHAFGLPLIWGTYSKLEGRSLSVARDARVPAIYVEYLGGGRCHPAGVHSLFIGCLSVMREFDMLDFAADPARTPVIHENNNPDSGHMQACYPAPKAGRFEPSVRLGQGVGVGETLGVLSDSFSGVSCRIPAVETGAVIVLRTNPRVDQGDSLAVILENADELPSVT